MYLLIQTKLPTSQLIEISSVWSCVVVRKIFLWQHAHRNALVQSLHALSEEQYLEQSNTNIRGLVCCC